MVLNAIYENSSGSLGSGRGATETGQDPCLRRQGQPCSGAPRRRAVARKGPQSGGNSRHRPEPRGSAARSVLLPGWQARPLLPPATGWDRARARHSRRARLAGALQRHRTLAVVVAPALPSKSGGGPLQACYHPGMTDDDQQSLFGALPAMRPPSRIQQRLIRSAVEIEANDPDAILFQHTVFCQTGLPYRDPGPVRQHGTENRAPSPSEFVQVRSTTSTPAVGVRWFALWSQASTHSRLPQRRSAAHRLTRD